VDLACSEVVALNDEMGRKKIEENILGVNGEYTIHRLLVE